jgi:uncharacterized protein YbbK (DUF523 family)
MTKHAGSLTWDRNTQPIVGVSACLIGENVTYDGGNRCSDIIRFEVEPWVNLRPFCPEVAAGLGVPRPAVKLISAKGEIKAVGEEDPSLDITDRLSEASRLAIEQWGNTLSGYIVKARSPSCGSATTALSGANNVTIGLTDGLFVAALKQANPRLMIVDESFFASKETAEAFLNNCYYQHQKSI